MSITATESRPLELAKCRTTEVFHQVVGWLDQRAHTCHSTRLSVEFAINVVSGWTVAIESLVANERLGNRDQCIRIINGIYPHLQVAQLILSLTSTLRHDATYFECASAYSTNFDRAVQEMARITAYVESFRSQVAYPCNAEIDDEDSVHGFEADDPFAIAFTETVVSDEGAQRLKTALAAGLARPTSPAVAIEMR